MCFLGLHQLRFAFVLAVHFLFVCHFFPHLHHNPDVVPYWICLCMCKFASFSDLQLLSPTDCSFGSCVVALVSHCRSHTEMQVCDSSEWEDNSWTVNFESTGSCSNSVVVLLQPSILPGRLSKRKLSHIVIIGKVFPKKTKFVFFPTKEMFTSFRNFCGTNRNQERWRLFRCPL